MIDRKSTLRAELWAWLVTDTLRYRRERRELKRTIRILKRGR